MKPNTLHLLSMLMRWATGAAVLAAPVVAAAPPADPGYLFYTPAQRAQLEQARARNITTTRQADAPASEAPAPLRYDGKVIRSDGRATHWIDGRPQADPTGAAGLKPGQVRADGRVFEPYQVLRPAPIEKPVPAAPVNRPRESTEPTP